MYKDLGSESGLWQASVKRADPYLLKQSPEFGPCKSYQHLTKCRNKLKLQNWLHFCWGPRCSSIHKSVGFPVDLKFICCFMDTRYLTYCYSIGSSWPDGINSTMEMMCELYINSYGLNLQKHGFSHFIAPFSNHLQHADIRICPSALYIKRPCMSWIEALTLPLHNLTVRTHLSICCELL